jgi:hypothetical protein
MTDPQETSRDVHTVSHSEGEPDQTGRSEDEGSDVGGPAVASESTTEQALSGVTTVGEEDDPHDQAKNPN